MRREELKIDPSESGLESPQDNVVKHDFGKSDKPAVEPELSSEQQKNLADLLALGYETRMDACIDLLNKRDRRDELEAINVKSILKSVKSAGKWFYKKETSVDEGGPEQPKKDELTQLNDDISRLEWLIKNSGRVIPKKLVAEERQARLEAAEAARLELEERAKQEVQLQEPRKAA